MINMMDPEVAEDDSWECLEMLVRLGRALPANQWVEDVIVAEQQQAQRQNLESVF